MSFGEMPLRISVGMVLPGLEPERFAARLEDLESYAALPMSRTVKFEIVEITLVTPDHALFVLPASFQPAEKDSTSSDR